MKQLFLIPILILLMITGCKKIDPEVKNQPPVAIAGNDTTIRQTFIEYQIEVDEVFPGGEGTIVQPSGHVILNGSASYDSDGKIKSYQWRQISGPKTARIMSPQQAIVQVTNLSPGDYGFELRVTDDHDLYSTDNMLVRVNPPIP